MHNNDLTRQRLAPGKGILNTKTLSKGENYWNYSMDDINIYYEVLPLSRDEMLSGNPIAVDHYMRKIKEHPDSYFLTVDTDSTCLSVHSILGTSSAHIICSPTNTIDWLRHNALIQSMLRKRTVFTRSKLSQEELFKTFNIISHVWPSFIDPARHKFPRSKNGKRKIGYYSAGPHKGDSIVYSLIGELPDCHFVIMGNDFQNIQNLPNVTFLGQTTDLCSFYGEISLLLVPSLKAEGFPRVIMEGAINGIPAIANKIGGIPDAMGDSGVLIEMESIEKMVENYKTAIYDLLNDQKKYEVYSDRAIKRAEKYKLEVEKISTDYDNKFF
jgi:glycosyltransferase involved in cell wall biosynthesis